MVVLHVPWLVVISQPSGAVVHASSICPRISPDFALGPPRLIRISLQQVLLAKSPLSKLNV